MSRTVPSETRRPTCEQAPLEQSREIYCKARMPLAALDGFDELVAFPEIRPDPTQAFDDFETVYTQAGEAQVRLTATIAGKWEVDPNNSKVRHPVPGTALSLIHI
eukprot:4469841-Prymnesium_polylepis.2